MEAAAIGTGTRIGAFTLLRPLGAGGAAEVWLANDAALGREVAIKIALKRDDASCERFLAEARALAAVRNANVVPVLAYGIDDATGRPYFTMPAMAGTLSTRLGESNRMGEAGVASLGLALVNAIDALHAAGLVHRDIKPSNILLDGDGRPVLADPSPTGGGTPGWVAPEQLDRNEATAATDFHALGLVLYRALTGGLPPPRGILPPSIEPPPGALPRDLSPAPGRGWENLLIALLAPDPEARLADAATVRRKLSRLLRAAMARYALRRFAAPAAIALAVAAATVCSVAYFGSRANERQAARDGGSAPGFDHREWAGQCAANLHGWLDAAIENPTVDRDGRIVVAEGRTLLLGDLDASGMDEGTPIVLDGGRFSLGVSAQALREFCAELEDCASGRSDELPKQAVFQTERARHVANPILITDKGGTLDSLDAGAKPAKKFHIIGGIAPADGATRATLHVFGFSDIVLDRAGLDPAVAVTGCGQILDQTNQGQGGGVRWFDYENPL